MIGAGLRASHRDARNVCKWHSASFRSHAPIGSFRSEVDINSGKSQKRIYDYTPLAFKD